MKFRTTGLLLNVLLSACTAIAPRPLSQTTAASNFTFTAVGDIGSSPGAAATIELIPRVDADFHLALGDLSYSIAPETSWCDFVTARVGSAFPFQLVAGNHEDDYGNDGHITRFAECLPDRIGVTGDYPAQYYFDYRDLLRLVVISPDLTISGKHYYYGDANDNYNWLATVIDDARTRGVPWVVVAMHKSCLSMGEYYCNIYSDLMNLLVSRKVDLILQAHEHNYQRTKQISLSPSCGIIPIDAFDASCVVGTDKDDFFVKGAGSIELILGTGGGELYDINSSDSEAGFFVRGMGANVSPRNGLMKFSVSRERIAAEFVGSTATSDYTDSFVIAAAPR